MAQNTYLIPNQTLPCLNCEDNLEDLIEFISLVESLGIKTAGTRIAKYKNYYEGILKNSGEEEKIFQGIDEKEFNTPQDIRLYALREVHEIMWILKGLKKHLPKGIAEKLNQVISGTDFAALDKDTVSRNTQFELRIASYFCQAGYLVDMSNLTDVIATRDGLTYFVECKRVSSYSALIKRLKEAKKQLKSVLYSNAYGIIAIDVTRVAFKHNGLTLGITADHTRDIIQDKLKEIDAFVLKNGFDLGQQNMLLIWLQIHIPALVLFPNQGSTRFSSYFAPNKLTKHNIKAFKLLQQALHIGEISDERTKPPKKLKSKSGLITLPKGTIVGWDEELLMSMLDCWKLKPREPHHTVLEIEMNGKKRQFCYFELSLLLPNLSKEDKLRLSKDHILARFELACMLIHLRSLSGDIEDYT